MDDFDAAVSASLQGLPPPAPMDPATAARFGMSQAVGANGDLEADLQRVAAKTGVPISTVRAQPEEAKRQATMGDIDFDHLATVAPSTAALLGDIDKAKVVHDDVDNLKALEESFRGAQRQGRAVRGKVGEPFQRPGDRRSSSGRVDETFVRRGEAQGEERSFIGGFTEPVRTGLALGGRGLTMLLANMGLLPISTELGARLAEQQRGVERFPTPPAIQQAMSEISGATTMGEAARAALFNPRAALEVALQSVGASSPALLGAAVGSTMGPLGTAAGAGLGSFAVEYASTLQDVMAEKGINGRDADAVTRALNNPEIMAAAREKALKRGIAVGTFDALTAGLAGKILAGAKPTARSIGTRMAGEFGVQAGGGAAGEAVAQAVTGEYKPGDILMEALAEMPSALVEAPANVRHAREQVAQAEQDATVVQNIATFVAASKVRERDADTFEGFMQSATEDGPLEKLYINPADLQKAGIDLTQLAEVAPSVAAEYQQALETGTDIAVPTSELMTRLPGSTLEQSLLGHLKTDPGGFSQLGAQEYMQTRGETERAEVEKVLVEHQADSAFKDSMRAVEANVLGQLTEANRFTEDVNAPYATLWSSFFGVQAARLGVMPQELFDRFAPRIVAQAPAGGLEQGDAPHARITGTEFGTDDTGVAELRKAAKAWYEANLRGTSVVNKASGRTVIFGRGNKAFSSAANPEKVRLFAALPGLVENGRIVSSHAPADRARETNVRAYHWLEGTAQIAGRGVRVGVMLREDDGGNLYYNHNPISDEGLLPPEGPGRTAQSRGLSNEGGDLEQSVSPAPDDINLQLLQQARGSFNPDTSVVALLKAADLSTFLHESGHFFLEVLDDLAAQPDAPQQIVDDFAAFLRWSGVEAGEPAEGEKSTADERRAAAWRAMTLDQKRAHHEDFARGFEAYLFEGKAPSVELRGVFQRFRAWLLNVYRSLANLNVNLNSEIRGVFDRMLATTEEIRLAEDVRGYEALFKNKPEGMTDDEWAVYQVQANDATQQAISELESRSLKDMQWLTNARGRELKKLQREAASKRKAIEAQVREEVEAMPVYQAIAAVKEIRKSDPQDRAAVVAWKAQRDAEEARLAGVVKEQYLATPEGAASVGIKRGQFLARSKRLMANEVEKMVLQWEQRNPRPKVTIPEADLAAVAALHGFTSGDELGKAIDAAAPIKEVIEGLTDQRMLERHADLVDEQAVQRAAEEAIHNDARLRFTATEANALRKAVGQPALLAKALRQFADDIVARTKVRDLKPAVYTAAEKRAGRDAARAAAEGKIEDAAVQKRNQLINGHAAKAMLDAQDEAEKVVAYLRRMDKESESIDADYRDQIHAMLERFDLRNSSLRRIDSRTSLAKWVAAQEEAGLEPDIPADLLNEANRTSFKNLSMEQLRGLRDTVKQIEHLGRLKHKLLTARDQRSYEAIRDSIVQSINDNAGDKVAANRTRPTTLNSAIRMWDGYLLEHRKVASLVRELDGFKDGGTMWEYFVRTMNDAGNTETVMRAEAADKLAALVRPMMEGGKTRKEMFIEGAATSEDRARGKTGSSFTREERLAIALNMGNEGNTQRLLDGEGWGLDNVKAILDTLTAADWQFVQGVWDYLETFRPLIAAKERRVYGKEPNWVDARALAVETADGKRLNLRGGYYPIKYDTARSARAEEHADAEAAKQEMRGAYTSATTRSSFTKARAERVTDRPLMYSTEALFNGVNEIIHDLSWHEWLIDANRLLRSESIGNAVRTRYGAQVMQQLKSGVKDIAAGEFPATKAFERVTTRLRAGAMMAGLGLNIMNSVINVQGITQSMVRIGPKWTAVGIGRFTQNPRSLAREVHARSELMANRAKTLNREVNEIQSLLRDKSKAREVAERIMFMPLTMTQQVVDLPTWWGAYQKALDGGNTEDRAVALADQAVIDAQSGGQIKDLAGIQRGGPLLKLWTTFYGFFNSTYNLTVESTKATDFKSPLQVVQLAGNYLLLWTLPALLGTLLKQAFTGGDWDDPEKLAKKAAGDQISYLLGMMVGVREFSSAAQAATGTSQFGASYAGPAGARFVGEVTKLAVQASQGEADAAFLKSLNNVFGIVSPIPYPSGQINRTAEGIAALHAGETKNPLAIIAGPPPKN